MPPKVTKGKDIRHFFGASSQKKSSSQGTSSQSTRRTMATTPATSQEVIEIISDDDDEVPVKKEKPKEKHKEKHNPDDNNDEMDVDEKPKPTKKRKSQVVLSDSEESLPEEEQEERPAKKKYKAKFPNNPSPVIVTKDQAAVAVAPTASKPSWASIKAAKLAGPSNPGSKDIPEGADEAALEGLTFVFTGELSSFSREEAQDIAKRFGARVTLQPSSKTSYVVVGEGAGPSKLKALEKHGIKQLTEDGWLELIATRKGPCTTGKDGKKMKEKKEKEEKEIRKKAMEMEQEEKKDKGKGKSAVVDPNSQLWTTKYAPTSLKDICGNKANIDKLKAWLDDWQKNSKSSFKKPGKNLTGTFRAFLITGPPGIGKTTSAHLCAQAAGYTPVEFNASDVRSKKLIEKGMNVDNKSIDGWIGGSSATNSQGVAITDKTCLIMDEVDGMSAGDRGGVGALNALIKASKVPIICIANDKNAQKLKPLVYTCFAMTFQKPQVSQVRSRILSIAFREKMKIPANVVDQLIAGAQSDIRLVLNMLSTWRLGHDPNSSMDYDEGKKVVKANEKSVSVLSPFEVTSRVLGPYMFSHTNRESLGDKMEYYFMDHSFVPLFIQENYLKPEPARCKNLEGPEKDMKLFEMMDRAATSISDGDLVDALIHGPDQQWSLMPLHAVCSTLRPASCVYGAGMGYFGSYPGGGNGMSFPQWLGQNSRRNKLMRALGDVQVRMRLKASGDKDEIRQVYIPTLHSKLVDPMRMVEKDQGVDTIGEVIDVMDEYFLSKEDWDTIVELGVGEKNQDVVLKKLPTSAKSALTRKYNATEHPIAYHKSTILGGKGVKQLAAGPAPDVEDAIEMDEEPVGLSDSDSDEVLAKAKKGKKGDNIVNDSLVKASKKSKSRASISGKNKGGDKGEGSSKVSKGKARKK